MLYGNILPVFKFPSFGYIIYKEVVCFKRFLIKYDYIYKHIYLSICEMVEIRYNCTRAKLWNEIDNKSFVFILLCDLKILDKSSPYHVFVCLCSTFAVPLMF